MMTETPEDQYPDQPSTICQRTFGTEGVLVLLVSDETDAWHLGTYHIAADTGHARNAEIKLLNAVT